jgi:hypothetical protein
METFKIEVQESLSKVVEIQASDSSEAILKVEELYKKSKVVLDYNDFVDVNFLDIKTQDLKSEKEELTNEIIEYLIKDEQRLDDAPQDHIYLKLKKLKELLNPVRD